MIQHSRESVLSEPNTLYLTLLSTLGELVHLALGYLTALVLVSNKTGPVRSQISTQQAAVAEWLWRQKSWIWISALSFFESLSPHWSRVSSVVEEGDYIEWKCGSNTRTHQAFSLCLLNFKYYLLC